MKDEIQTISARTSTMDKTDSSSRVGGSSTPSALLPVNKSDQQLVNEDFLETPSTENSVVVSRTPGASNIRAVTKRQWITVFILCFVNLINYMDRFTIAGILDKIKDTFSISNSEGGLLQTVFVISYMIFAPVFGYLGDRYSRRLIMAAGVLLWSLTTLLGSFMENSFTWFTVFRALVGIGEASYSTIAPTIISDLFTDDLRSKMLALFYFAIPVGSGMGYIVGSETARFAGEWQWGLRVTPMLGAIAVILILFVMIDPPRGESEGSELQPTTWSEDIVALGKNRSFMLSTLGFTCVTFVAGALAWWGPIFIYQGISLQEGIGDVSMDDVSFKFGVITMISGILGVPIGSMVAQKLRVRNPRADPLICAFGLLTSTPLLYLGSVFAQYNSTACFTLVFFGEFFLNLNWSIVADVLLYVVIPTRRSTAEAFQILVSHAFGDAGSPYLVGALSDLLRRVLIASYNKANVSLAMDSSTNATLPSVPSEMLKDDATDYPENIDFKSLQFSLFLTSFVEVLGAMFFFMTAWYIVADKQRADKAIISSAVDHIMAEERSSSSSSSNDDDIADEEVEVHVPLTQKV